MVQRGKVVGPERMAAKVAERERKLTEKARIKGQLDMLLIGLEYMQEDLPGTKEMMRAWEAAMNAINLLIGAVEKIK